MMAPRLAWSTISSQTMTRRVAEICSQVASAGRSKEPSAPLCTWKPLIRSMSASVDT